MGRFFSEEVSKTEKDDGASQRLLASRTETALTTYMLAQANKFVNISYQKNWIFFAAPWEAGFYETLPMLFAEMQWMHISQPARAPSRAGFPRV